MVLTRTQARNASVGRFNDRLESLLQQGVDPATEVLAEELQDLRSEQEVFREGVTSLVRNVISSMKTLLQSNQERIALEVKMQTAEALSEWQNQRLAAAHVSTTAVQVTHTSSSTATSNRSEADNQLQANVDDAVKRLAQLTELESASLRRLACVEADLRSIPGTPAGSPQQERRKERSPSRRREDDPLKPTPVQSNRSLPGVSRMSSQTLGSSASGTLVGVGGVHVLTMSSLQQLPMSTPRSSIPAEGNTAGYGTVDPMLFLRSTSPQKAMQESQRRLCMSMPATPVAVSRTLAATMPVQPMPVHSESRQIHVAAAPTPNAYLQPWPSASMGKVQPFSGAGLPLQHTSRAMPVVPGGMRTPTRPPSWPQQAPRIASPVRPQQVVKSQSLVKLQTSETYRKYDIKRMLSL